MELPKIPRFDPVPVRARHDGRSADDKRRFILKLSRGHLVDEACRSLGHSRQSAYALRRRAGAQSFARAWDRALIMARTALRARRCRPAPDLSWALETLLVPKFYRGPHGRVHSAARQPQCPSPARRVRPTGGRVEFVEVDAMKIRCRFSHVDCWSRRTPC
jgi:hypothetical protein